NDHTDGHIDTLARFVGPGTVVCMKPQDSSDPNFETLNEIAEDLRKFTDARTRKLNVIEIPSPGLVKSDEGQILPASYINFYIGNTAVVVPSYGVAKDREAVEKIASCFPNRKVVGRSAKAILSGG